MTVDFEVPMVIGMVSGNVSGLSMVVIVVVVLGRVVMLVRSQAGRAYISMLLIHQGTCTPIKHLTQILSHRVRLKVILRKNKCLPRPFNLLYRRRFMAGPCTEVRTVRVLSIFRISYSYQVRINASVGSRHARYLLDPIRNSNK